ncbi:MAG: signal peptidase II [Bacteroidetes bacterium]|nr:MAG: signal peptidase II [Bacteroidota bacterium]
MNKHLIRILLILGILVLNIGCDQVTKEIARKQLEYHERIEVLGDYVVLTKVENTGAFLSLGSEMPKWLRTGLLLVLPAIVLLFGLLLILIKKQYSLLFVVGMSFVLGGGLGNLYDRMLYGSVTDFVHIGIGSLRTGIFNMADVSIMVGMGILLAGALFSKKKDPQSARANKQEGETGK